MNLQKLFDAQKVLRERIDYNEPDRFEKLVLALLVEIGECANEWRGFKFWSKDQESRTFVPNPDDPCKVCDGQGMLNTHLDFKDREFCRNCDGCGVHFYNPLLEEYVDGLHFVLELGIELNINTEDNFGQYTGSNVTEQFVFVFRDVSELHKSIHEDWDEEAVNDTLTEMIMGYIGLGEMLGFTPEQIETAYFAKNQINHQRQEEGY